jgi:putative nucleotidyltransferase-like protein
VVAAALDHGLIGPLHSIASKTASVPSQILSSIRTRYLSQVAHNFQLTTALNEIVRTFTAAGIEVAVLKGAAVALMAYGHVAQREFTDLDLLVHPEDFNRAQFVLESLGYHHLNRNTPHLSSEKDVQFVRKLDDTFVELHWALNPPDTRFPLDETGIWERIETLRVFDQPIRTLSLEDTLIALCIHASKHRWTSLKWTFDIATIATRKSDTLNWDILLQRCAAVGCTRTLLFGLQLASLLFDLKAPARLTAPISMNSWLAGLVEIVKVSLLQSKPLTISDLMRCHIEVHDRFWDRLSIATLPFPDLPGLLPKAAQAITSGPLRFITRPVRLLYMYGFHWLRTTIVGR